MGDLNKRKGVISTTETNMDITKVEAEVHRTAQSVLLLCIKLGLLPGSACDDCTLVRLPGSTEGHVRICGRFEVDDPGMQLPYVLVYGFSDLSSFAVLRWCVQGKGDFSMEYKAHVPVAQHLQEELIAELRTQRAARDASS